MAKRKKGYKADDYLVTVYVNRIKDGEWTIERVPKIANLREIVAKVLKEDDRRSDE